MKKHNISMALLSILTAILVANSMKICWNDFIFEKTRKVYYSSQGGKQVALNYDYHNKPKIYFDFNKSLGYVENNTPDNNIIWEYEGEAFMIPPSIKITWISENEIHVNGTNFFRCDINETISTP